MSAHDGLQGQPTCEKPTTTLERLAERSGGALVEVVATERALKAALVPIATAARERETEVVCEVLPGVGEHVLDQGRELVERVAAAVREAVQRTKRSEVVVRMARQATGFDPSDLVLVSVAVHDDDKVEDVAFFELDLPRAANDTHADGALFGARVLVVAPAKSARVQSAVVRGAAATATAVHDASQVKETLAAARAAGAPFDIVYVDDAVDGAMSVVELVHDDPAAEGAVALVASSVVDADERRRILEAGAFALLSKPVMPTELTVAVADARIAREVTRAAPPLKKRATHGKRSSGVRRLNLAAVLTSMGVVPRKTAR